MSRSDRNGYGRVLIAVVAVLGAGLAAAEPADVVLKSGLRLRGDVTVTETEVIVRNELGEVRYPREQVENVVPVTTALEPTTAPATQPVAQPATAAADIEDEYRRRFDGLAHDDAAGHFALCEWLVRQGRPDVAREQCEYVLRLDPQHAGARELLAQLGGETEPTERREVLPPPRLLTPAEIQRLKFAELRLEGPPEKLRVRFAGKDQRALPREIQQELLRQPNYDSRWGEILSRGQPWEKLQLIVRRTGWEYADRITILDDPEVFATFRLRVLPNVLRGCAKSGCHAGDQAAVFRFPAGPSSTEAFAYTVFHQFDGLTTRYGPLINRDKPDSSVLLSFMLPEKDNPQPHPPVTGKPRFTPTLRNRQNAVYEAIRNWVKMLRTPRPQYNVGPLDAPPEPPANQARGGTEDGEQSPADVEENQPATRPTPTQPGRRP